MDRGKEIELISKDIYSLLHKLEVTFWDVFVNPANFEDYWEDENKQAQFNYEKHDKKTSLFQGAKELFYKICLFFEMKNVPLHYKMFINKCQPIIDDEELVTESRDPLYTDDLPSLAILDQFREFLSPFQEFNTGYFSKLEVNKLKQILENTNSIIQKTNTKVTNETSIYKPVKWFIEIVYPTCRNKGKARFIKKFTTYHPDILIPEINAAVEYKFIRKGSGIEIYLDQLKTDADNYEEDPEYKFFYAVVYFEDKSELNPAGFKQAIIEKKFPDNWTFVPL